MRQSGELMVGQPSFGPIIEKSGYNDVSRTSTDIHGAVVWCSDRKKRQRAMKHGQSSIEGYDAYTRQIEVLTHISTFRRQIESNYNARATSVKSFDIRNRMYPFGVEGTRCGVG
jgi:hypothetical protein